MKFPELEDLIPGLREERERKEAKAQTVKAAGGPTPVTPPQGAGGTIPPVLPGSAGMPQGGNVRQIGGR